jgi:hypothetical protein
VVVRAARLDMLADLVAAGFDDVDRSVAFEVLRSHLGELRALQRRLLERHVRG